MATAYEQGLSEVGNGELLRRAEGRFEVLVTTDQNLRYQQDLSGLRLAILVLPTTSWSRIRKHVGRIVAAIDGLAPGECRELEFGAG